MSRRATRDVALRYDIRVRRIEALISTLLRAGVIVSVVLITAGVLVTFARHGSYLTSANGLDGLKAGTVAFPTTPAAVVRGIGHGDGLAIAALGLLTLLATPILRVAVSIGIFAVTGERVFMVITMVVLALLLASLFLGNAGG